jgi:hypothetical protein
MMQSRKTLCGSGSGTFSRKVQKQFHTVIHFYFICLLLDIRIGTGSEVGRRRSQCSFGYSLAKMIRLLEPPVPALAPQHDFKVVSHCPKTFLNFVTDNYGRWAPAMNNINFRYWKQ